MTFNAPPRSAAWRHHEAREGFEVVFMDADHDGYRVKGSTTAVEDSEPWLVDYEITTRSGWVTHTAVLAGRSTVGKHDVALEADGAGRWQINGLAAPHLDGCVDVDLESSALTNALPVHRLGLAIGEGADAPAAYVRAVGLTVERLEQRYARLEDDEGRERYHYSAPGFGFECELIYDDSGLVVAYPGIAVRAS